MELRDRYRGCLLGLAVGDALGTTLEFKQPGTYEPISDMVGGGPFCLEAGEWTDDTSMALCLTKSLIEKQGFDARDQMERYVKWWREGYMSSTGRCFDIGNTVSSALATFELTDDPYAGDEDPRAGGNGSLMRLAPIPLAFRNDPAVAIAHAADMSRTTHAARAPVDACRVYTALIIGAMNGANKEELLAPEYVQAVHGIDLNEVAPEIAQVVAGSYREKHPPELRGTGYVVDALEAALWAFAHSDSFEEGALLAVNLGDDADTTGAIFGQLAGAYYGMEGIPSKWRYRVVQTDMIQIMAHQLQELSELLTSERPQSVCS